MPFPENADKMRFLCFYELVAVFEAGHWEINLKQGVELEISSLPSEHSTSKKQISSPEWQPSSSAPVTVPREQSEASWSAVGW